MPTNKVQRKDPNLTSPRNTFKLKKLQLNRRAQSVQEWWRCRLMVRSA